MSRDDESVNDAPQQCDLRHEFADIRFDDGTVVPEIRFDDPRARLVGRLLMNDLQGRDAQGALDLIDRVLAGRLPVAEIAGNTTRAVVGPQTTRLIDDIGSPADEANRLQTDVATRSLRAIIVEWFGYAARTRARYAQAFESDETEYDRADGSASRGRPSCDHEAGEEHGA
ncbi:hypothetical protein [Pseudoclavibacter sp. CFCC 11306]|uniref:hypothetical protein n=1 Tax=Pseudoclavibacter sp. CFCC 11306 TaxID=1564493 RepID=UPI001300D5C6|nr:hypothetical protein [Pseudoclavibacter sp. CFCC 11306]KAB1657471.1 hypothetical protein F8O09_07470 [Pseudoclavibacter sp. CFCC 11306]